MYALALAAFWTIMCHTSSEEEVVQLMHLESNRSLEDVLVPHSGGSEVGDIGNGDLFSIFDVAKRAECS